MVKSSKTRRSKPKKVKRDLVVGWNGRLRPRKAVTPNEPKYSCEEVVLDIQPPKLNATQVKAIRRLLGADQALFAQFLGVSVHTVRAWEGGKPPGDLACRFMDEIQRHPAHWQKRLRESLKPAKS